MRSLEGDFVVEVLKACLTNRSFFDSCKDHVKYNYLPGEEYKLIWKEILGEVEVNDNLPTIGMLSQRLVKKDGVNSLLGKIKKVKINDVAGLLVDLEEFIQMSMFVSSYDKMGDAWNRGDQNEAFEELGKLNDEIQSLSLNPSNTYSKVFDDFEQRHKERVQENADYEYDEVGNPILGIDALDDFHRGTLERGDTVLFCAQSGVGKSLGLRWVGISNARRGLRVVHFQGEDTKKLCMRYYDSLWSGHKFGDIERANISDNKLKELLKNIKNLKRGRGEVIVEAFEQFGSASLLDCRRILNDIQEDLGEIDVIIWDYLEKFEPGDGKRYSTNQEGERMRRQAVGDGIKNLSMEFNALGVTATQASSIKKEDWNNPDWYMTRANVAEFKQVVNPFSYFYTFNQTKDEYEDEIMRIYVDKMRKAKSGQLVPIAMHRDNGRFYNKKRTLEDLWDNIKKKPRDY